MVSGARSAAMQENADLEAYTVRGSLRTAPITQIGGHYYDRSKEQWDAEMDEIIRECEASTKKLEEEERAIMERLEANPYWQEAKKTKFIDWNDGREKLLESGMSVTNVCGREEWSLDIHEHCFVENFPSLTVGNAHLTDCIFVNCGRITLEDGTAVKCSFMETETILLNNVKVYDSVFMDLHCEQGGFVIGMEDSTLSGCKFRNIRLENDNYLADGAGDCLIEKCSFEKISTDREDRELFTCEEPTGKIIRKWRKYDMVDRDSCTGLDNFEGVTE